MFYFSERLNHEQARARRGQHEHLEQFNVQDERGGDGRQASGLTKPYRKLVAIRSPHNLFMLEKALAETDPETTERRRHDGQGAAAGRRRPTTQPDLDIYDQQLMTAVVERAEKAGKQVKPLIVPTNNPLHAILQTANDLQAQELILGASNKYTADEQLEQIAFYWINLHARQAGAADRAPPEPRPRRVSRPGRRQPHPEDQRAAGAARSPSCGRPASASIASCSCTTAPAPPATCSGPC